MTDEQPEPTGTEAGPGTEASAAATSPPATSRRPRRRRRLRITFVVLAVLAVVAAFALRTPSPVGHWDDAAGQDRYLAAYTRAFEDLPEPDETRDVRTDYGMVRVYGVDGTGSAEAPMVLVVGTR